MQIMVPNTAQISEIALVSAAQNQMKTFLDETIVIKLIKSVKLKSFDV